MLHYQGRPVEQETINASERAWASVEIARDSKCCKLYFKNGRHVVLRRNGKENKDKQRFDEKWVTFLLQDADYWPETK